MTAAANRARASKMWKGVFSMTYLPTFLSQREARCAGSWALRLLLLLVCLPGSQPMGNVGRLSREGWPVPFTGYGDLQTGRTGRGPAVVVADPRMF